MTACEIAAIVLAGTAVIALFGPRMAWLAAAAIYDWWVKP